MRVAHILRKYDPSEWGGTETAIQRLVHGLGEDRVSSLVFAPRLAGRAVPDPFLGAGGVLRPFRAVLPFWGVSGKDRRQMIALGGNVVSLDLFGALWREPGLDVIHSHALGRLGAIARAAARVRRLPFVLSVHGGAYDLPTAARRELDKPASGGWDWGKPLGMLLRARQLFSAADAIITCNPREAALIRERHPDRQVMVQPHGVPAANFAADRRGAARAAFPEIADRDVLFMPGRIDPVKNQGWVLAHLARLLGRHPRALLVLAGAATDRAYASALEERVRADGLSRHVLFAGQLPPGDARLVGLLQEARAVLLPSVSETFGLVILEAWAAGTPVVSSRTSGATALVEDGKNGRLFDLARPGEFLAAVDSILDNPPGSAAMGAAGRRRVEADYDTVVLARRMKRLYQELREGNHALRCAA